MSGVKILHFLKIDGNPFQFTQNYTMALTDKLTCQNGQVVKMLCHSILHQLICKQNLREKSN